MNLNQTHTASTDPDQQLQDLLKSAEDLVANIQEDSEANAAYFAETNKRVNLLVNEIESDIKELDQIEAEAAEEFDELLLDTAETIAAADTTEPEAD